jgi:hypothetical protein
MKRRWARTAAAVLAAGGALGGGLVGHQAAVADDDATRPFELWTQVSCERTFEPGGVTVSVTGVVHTVGTVPVSVVVGEPIRLRGTVTAALEGSGPVTVTAGYQTSEGDGAVLDVADTSAPLDVSFGTGGRGPLTIRQTVQIVSVTPPGGGEPESVGCRTTAAGPPLEVGIDLPTDGSSQWLDLDGPAHCSTTDGDVFDHTFRLHGVAPARLAPGESGVLAVATYQGLAGMFGEDVALSTGGPRSISFTTHNGARDLRLTIPPAQSGTTMEIAFSHASGVLQRLQPQAHAVDYSCEFASPDEPLRIPVSGPSITTTAASTGTPTPTPTTTTTSTTTTSITTPPCTTVACTTTTTTHRPDPRCALHERFPGWLWRLFAPLLRIRC